MRCKRLVSGEEGSSDAPRTSTLTTMAVFAPSVLCRAGLAALASEACIRRTTQARQAPQPPQVDLVCGLQMS